MLWLKRNTRFNELYKCKVSGELIGPGDYFYEDDEDGVIIKADVYYDLKKKKEEDEFDYTKLNNAQSQREYELMLQQYEREFLSQTILDRKIAGKE